MCLVFQWPTKILDPKTLGIPKLEVYIQLFGIRLITVIKCLVFGSLLYLAGVLQMDPADPLEVEAEGTARNMFSTGDSSGNKTYVKKC